MSNELEIAKGVRQYLEGFWNIVVIMVLFNSWVTRGNAKLLPRVTWRYLILGWLDNKALP